MKLRYTLIYEVDLGGPYQGRNGMIISDPSAAAAHEQELVDTGYVDIAAATDYCEPLTVTVTPVTEGAQNETQ